MVDTLRRERIETVDQLPDMLRSMAAMGVVIRISVTPEDAREVARLIEAGQKVEAERAALNARRDAINTGWQANQVVLGKAREIQDRGRSMMVLGFFMSVAGFAALLTCLVVPG